MSNQENKTTEVSVDTIVEHQHDLTPIESNLGFMPGMSDEERSAVIDKIDNPLPRDENETPTRYTEAALVEQAATSAHPDIPNSNVLDEKIHEITMVDTSFAGISKRISDELWIAVANELQVSVSKLKAAKSFDDRMACLHHAEVLQDKLEILLETFIE